MQASLREWNRPASLRSNGRGVEGKGFKPSACLQESTSKSNSQSQPEVGVQGKISGHCEEQSPLCRPVVRLIACYQGNYSCLCVWLFPIGQS
uniref:Uncharacterized protein n=1 Tax=Picea glauca TaxID=3330 RepID=A0A101LWI3_PICGL|nr:hypothetical protein ABT39_MTgene1315 [Picea glauca]QHR89539.1 hypothetical protein Q903MT_gene3561 [Picea sitchensis]